MRGAANSRGGEFFRQRPWTRAILVRFVISSVDGDKTWELNWIAVDTRVKPGT